MNNLRFSTLLAVICISVCCTDSFAQQDSLFFNQPVDSVLMVEFEWRGKSQEIFDVVDKHGNLPSTTLRKVVIAPKEQASLIRSLNSKHSFGGGHSACYEPHLGFVFYNDGKISGYITICVGCNYLIPSQEIPVQQQNKYISDDGSVQYLGSGMSESFLKKLDQLLAHYAFQYRVER